MTQPTLLKRDRHQTFTRGTTLQEATLQMIEDPECWCGAIDPQVHATDCREIGLSILRAANLRAGALAGAHKPGDSHWYRIKCEVCGQRGQVVLSVEPQTIEPLQEEQ